MAAPRVQLDQKTIERLNELINPRTVSGARYNAATQTEIDTEEIRVRPHEDAKPTLDSVSP